MEPSTHRNFISDLATQNDESAAQDKARLNNLLAIEAEIKKQEKLFRRAAHELEAALMKRPITPAAAWGYFGLLLGALPPAAIFYALFKYGFAHQNAESVFFFLLLLAMNIVCALVGRKTAQYLSSAVFKLERCSWTLMLLGAPLLGLAWGAVTGFFGGLLFFGIGALGGIFFAVPVGIVGFTVFVVLHRLLERGTMIERKHLLPLAYGISFAIATFFLGIN